MRGDIVEGIFEMHTLARWRVFLDGHAGPPLGARPDRPCDKTAAAVGAHVVEVVLDTVLAERAFVRADTRFRCAWRKVLVAIFAVRPELQRHGRLVMSGPDGPSQIRREMRMPNLPRFRPCQCHSAMCNCTSRMRQPNSGLPEFGYIICPSRQQPTWMAQARNPYSRWCLWIPGSLASLAPRNDNRSTNGPSAATP
jgi:hypothetical protein